MVSSFSEATGDVDADEKLFERLFGKQDSVKETPPPKPINNDFDGIGY